MVFIAEEAFQLPKYSIFIRLAAWSLGSVASSVAVFVEVSGVARNAILLLEGVNLVRYCLIDFACF